MQREYVSYEDLQLLIDVLKESAKDELDYVYRGYFTQNITNDLLILTEQDLVRNSEIGLIKKRVYMIMVEGLQNITKHQSKAEPIEKPAFFHIRKRYNKYFITTSNLINDNEIDALVNHVEIINKLDPEQLRVYYKDILSYGSISVKGGAGLGLIEMVRKSGNKLFYDFRPISKNISHFYLQTHTPVLETDNPNLYEDCKLSSVIDFHQLCRKIDIVLIINTIFTQDNMLMLLDLIKEQMQEQAGIGKKVYSVLVEMVQNIIHHAAENLEEMVGKHGIFFVCEKDNEYILCSANYLSSTKVDKLRNKLERINTMSATELEEYYNSKLLDFEVENPKETGLGFVDIRMKTDTNLEYIFVSINSEISLFLMQASVMKLKN